MKTNSRYYRKPNILVLLTCFVGVGILATTLVQAAETSDIISNSKVRAEQPDWLHSLWSIDLAGKLQSWKPRISVDNRGEGLRLMRPFGVRGPVLRVNNGIPFSSSDNPYNAASTYLDTYLFLEKRW